MYYPSEPLPRERAPVVRKLPGPVSEAEAERLRQEFLKLDPLATAVFPSLQSKPKCSKRVSFNLDRNQTLLISK